MRFLTLGLVALIAMLVVSTDAEARTRRWQRRHVGSSVNQSYTPAPMPAASTCPCGPGCKCAPCECTGGTCPVPAASPASVSGLCASLLALHNAERARYGVAPLALEAGLCASAQNHSRLQASVRSMHHASGGDWRGENVAWNQRTPAEVMRSWMNSPGHRDAILNPNYTTVGFGEVNQYWTTRFK